MRYDLAVDRIPTAWFNVLPVMPAPLQPPLHPATNEPVGPDDLAPLFPMGLIAQEVSAEPWIDVPGEVLDILRAVAARRRSCAPSGSSARSARRRASTSRTSRCRRRVRTSRTPRCRRRSTTRPRASPGSRPRPAPASGAPRSRSRARSSTSSARCTWCARRTSRSRTGKILMETWGAEVVPSPVDDPDHPGSLGLAISDAVRDAATRDDTHYSLGSVLNHVLLHQTVIGLEAKEQLALAGEERPDVVIGCCGGGSNLGGIALPFVPDADVRLVAVEPSSCPTLTEGTLRVRLRRHRGHDAAAADVHARPRLRPAVDPRRWAPLPRRLADHLDAGAVRAHGGGRLPAGQDVRGGGAVRPHRGQDARARDRPRRSAPSSTRRWRRRRRARSG